MESFTVPMGSPLERGAIELSLEQADRIGPYRPIGLLGRGGQGLVLRVRAAETGPDLALKILHPGEGSSVSERRFLARELEVSRRLHHPAIVPVLDYGETGGRAWIVMPLLSRGSLANRLEEGTLAPRDAVAVLLKVARGVAHAHQMGVLHRDLKPSNILLDEQGNPQVCDFGLARLADSCSRRTLSGQLLGSYPYMAPEQALGRSHEATTATDVWALGVILYEMLTGQRPFEGTTAEVLDRIRAGRYRSLRDRDPSLPAELDAILTKCLQRAPQRRYADAHALAEDLSKWLGGTPLSVGPEESPWGLNSRGATLFSLFLLGSLLPLGLSMLAAASPEPMRPQMLPKPAPGNRATLWAPRLGPRYAHFVFGGDEATYQPRREPGLVSTFTAALLELLPADERRGPYRLTLRAQQYGGNELTDVGLYAGYQADGPVGARVHRFLQCSFQEPMYFQLLGNDGPVRATLHPRTLIERPGGKPLPVGGSGVLVTLPRAPKRDRSAPPVRQLILEVHNEELRIDFEGRSARLRLSDALRLAEFARNLQKLTHIPPTRFLPSQPAGLVIWGSGLEIQSIVYEPLGLADKPKP